MYTHTHTQHTVFSSGPLYSMLCACTFSRCIHVGHGSHRPVDPLPLSKTHVHGVIPDHVQSAVQNKAKFTAQERKVIGCLKYGAHIANQESRLRCLALYFFFLLEPLEVITFYHAFSPPRKYITQSELEPEL